jgi:hypothetical protein
MTPQEIHHRIVTLADELGEMHMLISDGLPTDSEGFVRPANPDLADALLNHAGRFPGVGDYRVGKKGPFGRFSVELLNGAGEAS